MTPADLKKFAVPLGLVTGGITILAFLYSKAGAVDTSQGVPPGTDVSSGAIPAQQPGMPVYPNAQQSTPGASINIGGSPLYLTYNTPPPPIDPAIPVGDSEAAGCGCECGQGTLTAQLALPQANMDGAVQNLVSVFSPAAKLPTPAPAPKVLPHFQEVG